MKKIGVITFHATHNYGSNLQAYALQTFVEKLAKEYNQEVEYKIINLRTKQQKDLYNYKNKSKGIKKIIKGIMYLPYQKQMKQKREMFEKFINTKLHITKEYENEEELKNAKLDFDYYISGSDQVWNYRAWDFDWANYLGFVQKGKKISYSASFGPLKLDMKSEEAQKAKKFISQYDDISVREKGSYENVKELLGKESNVNVDPTMLLSKEEWLEVFDKKPIYKGDYILLYSLHLNKERVKIINDIAKKLGLKVVVSNPSYQYDITAGFKKIYNCGAEEFLNLVYNAKLVISSSFHGTVFSILLNKPFLALNGMEDLRISNLLEITNLQTRSINKDNYLSKIDNIYEIQFDEAVRNIEKEKIKSKEYLKNALEFE